jgi:hypothetical protein
VPDAYWNPQTGVVDFTRMAADLTQAQRDRDGLREHMSKTRNTAKKPDSRPVDDLSRVADEARAKAAQAAQDTPGQPEGTPASPATADGPAGSSGAPGAPLKPEELMALGQADWTKNNGSFSEDFYTKAQAAGYSKAMVDSFAQGQVAQQQAAVAAYDNALYQEAGGKEAFNQMAGWARVNMPNFDTVVNGIRSGNLDQGKLAVGALKAAYVAEHGHEGTLVTGSTPPSGAAGVVPFNDLSEVTQAMGSKEYQDKGAAGERVRAQVAQRLAASHRAGIDLGLRIMHNGQRIA